MNPYLIFLNLVQMYPVARILNVRLINTDNQCILVIVWFCFFQDVYFLSSPLSAIDVYSKLICLSCLSHSGIFVSRNPETIVALLQKMTLIFHELLNFVPQYIIPFVISLFFYKHIFFLGIHTRLLTYFNEKYIYKIGAYIGSLFNLTTQ